MFWGKKNKLSFDFVRVGGQDVDGKNGYIAAQGPMPNTINDFWRMLWQYKTEIVFMACRLKEDGRVSCVL